MKRLFRQGCCLLAGMLALLPFAGCRKQQETPDTPASSGGAQTEALYDADGYLNDQLPRNLSFGGEEIRLLYWSDVEMQEFEAEEQKDGELINNAIFSRNKTVEDRLGVSLKWLPQVGSSTDYNFNKFTAAVEQDQLAGNDYDVYATYSPGAGILASRGYNRDLMSVKYFDAENPWWPASLIDTCTVGGKLYYASGDISTNTLHFMYGVYYNADKIAALNLSDPYELVKSGDWTQEKMFEMASGLYKDSGTGKPTDDSYGFVTIGVHYDAFLIASDMRMVRRSGNGDWCLSEDFSSSRLHELILKLGRSISKSDDSYSGNGYAEIFSANRSLFVLDRVYLAYMRLQDVTFKYGVVPVPKYEKKQTGYYTCVGHPFTLYCISRGISGERADMAGAVLECLASEAYRKTTPAVFEVTYKLRYSEGAEMGEMFDYIRAGIVFDIARIQNVATGQIYQIFQSAVASSGTGWVALVKANAETFSEKLEILVESLKSYGN